MAELEQDEFIETELASFGFHEEVNKMVLQVLPEPRKESLENSGKDICPDFCILKNGEKTLRCPVTNYELETRNIRVSLKRYEDALVLAQIYGQKIGNEICRECIYKIILSPDSILTEDDLREIQKTIM